LMPTYMGNHIFYLFMVRLYIEGIRKTEKSYFRIYRFYHDHEVGLYIYI
jgi:hypothetical protein